MGRYVEQVNGRLSWSNDGSRPPSPPALPPGWQPVRSGVVSAAAADRSRRRAIALAGADDQQQPSTVREVFDLAALVFAPRMVEAITGDAAEQRSAAHVVRTVIEVHGLDAPDHLDDLAQRPATKPARRVNLARAAMALRQSADRGRLHLAGGRGRGRHR